jgi:hypothetical protein
MKIDSSAVFEKNAKTVNDDYLTVDIEQLIHFFDVDAGAQKDSSSIKGVIGEEFAFACMKRYFEDIGSCATVLTDRAGERISCTTGGRAGHQLDGWLKVENFSQTVFYQVEIKSWSFHGIGSKNRKMPIHDSIDIALAKKKAIFDHYYDSVEEKFKQSGVNKVLLKMKPPKKFQNFISKPQPLLCLWEAVSSENGNSNLACFSVPVAPLGRLTKDNGAICESGGFTQVSIFSVSNYLRSLLAKCDRTNSTPSIHLHLPRIAARIRRLQRIFQG